METCNYIPDSRGVEEGILRLTDGRVLQVKPVRAVDQIAAPSMTEQRPIDWNRIHEVFEAAETAAAGPNAENSQFLLRDRPD